MQATGVDKPEAFIYDVETNNKNRKLRPPASGG